ncbi:MAG: hypothetical protein AAB870_02100 [Patescibacteria group bacterium]
MKEYTCTGCKAPIGIAEIINSHSNDGTGFCYGCQTNGTMKEFETKGK